MQYDEEESRVHLPGLFCTCRYIDSDLWGKLSAKAQHILKNAGYRAAIIIATDYSAENKELPTEAIQLLRENGIEVN